jgi:Mrp family chromosome partitioning ATPase
MLGESSAEAPAALRLIRFRLEQKRAEGMWTFAVTSARDGEGKSVFATQLALVLSESQRATVLLAEANFHRPTVASLLGFRIPSGQGFSPQLSRKMHGSAEPWAVVALGPSLHVLAESPEEPGYPETLHSPYFTKAIGFLARGYDFVVVDSPSVLGSGEALVVEGAVDAVILVARSQRTKGADIREALKTLGGDTGKCVGVVLWDVTEGQKKSKR